MSAQPTTVILMPPLPEVAYASAPRSPPLRSAPTKKRRRLSPSRDGSEELLCALTGASPAPPRPRAASGSRAWL